MKHSCKVVDMDVSNEKKTKISCYSHYYIHILKRSMQTPSSYHSISLLSQTISTASVPSHSLPFLLSQKTIWKPLVINENG